MDHVDMFAMLTKLHLELTRRLDEEKEGDQDGNRIYEYKRQLDQIQK
jgi:hypothetical protein